MMPRWHRPVYIKLSAGEGARLGTFVTCSFGHFAVSCPVPMSIDGGKERAQKLSMRRKHASHKVCVHCTSGARSLAASGCRSTCLGPLLEEQQDSLKGVSIQARRPFIASASPNEEI
mmetsp:Transcript_2491/g.7443  ORF Transcript_2491/g.7443 Transcript_2491/m.7443 type:complete len:117 (+) Transcript_2491:1478-1828(+)